ncbi:MULTISPECIES: hypothetical protein [Polymorphospora]|uniref:Lipoprotein n=1 Tax=Polymorphospora lycopeni TaxID=3140240 RepID=A0ABV5CPT0_9ACTN
MPRVPRLAAASACVLAGAVLLAGCGTPPELRPRPGVPVPSASGSSGPSGRPGADAGRPPTESTTRPTPGITPVPGGTPSPSYGGYVAVSCAGNPSGAQVTDLLRRSPGLLRSDATVRVVREPVCADTWQYTVVEVNVPGRGSSAMQVVSTGRAASLILVTAGSNVCNARIRATAPAGIRTLACDA